MYRFVENVYMDSGKKNCIEEYALFHICAQWSIH